MKTHLRVAAAATAVALATGCGQVAHTGVARGASGASAKTTINPPAKKAVEKADAGAESLWGGSVGVQSASVSLSLGSWVRASLGRADFNGSTFGNSVSGSLRRETGTETVTLHGFSSSVQGRIGRASVIASISPGGWVTGRVGDRHVNLSVSRTMVTGDVDGRRFFLSGTGLEPKEDLGFTAALLVLAAAAE